MLKLALIVAFAAVASAQDTCPFYPGVCPITLDNVLDVAYHDPVDFYSCQSTCKNTNPNCNYFTIFDVDSLSKKKCFHFAECLETCPECITGMGIS